VTVNGDTSFAIPVKRSTSQSIACLDSPGRSHATSGTANTPVASCGPKLPKPPNLLKLPPGSPPPGLLARGSPPGPAVPAAPATHVEPEASEPEAEAGIQAVNDAPAVEPCATDVYGIPVKRTKRAREAGDAVHKFMNGRISFCPDSPFLPGLPNSRYFVIIACGVNAPREESGFVTTVSDLKHFIGEPERRGAIWHAFASKSEAQALWEGAKRELPIPLLVPR
jgi:hypothetical protein